MSAKTMTNVTDKSKSIPSTTNIFTENDSIDKDIAVEKVIRRLRLKRNIEVKKVSDVDSKLKRISPIVDKHISTVKLNQSVSSRQNERQKSTINANESPSKSKEFMEIEDDEIEDYLEIDQNVVEDLEALIPEEEIVSISNSLIQPEEQLPIASEDETAAKERKSDNTHNSEGTVPESFSTEGFGKTIKESESNELKDEPVEEIEAESVTQADEDQICIDTVENDIAVSNEIPHDNDTIKSNNNDSEIRTNNKLSSTPMSKKEATKRTSDVVNHQLIINSKKQKISPNLNVTQTKKQKLQNNKRPKQNSENCRKITDFFTIDSVKQEIQYDELSLETVANESSENLDYSKNSSVKADNLENILLDQKEITMRTRTLRSRSKLVLEKGLPTSNETFVKGNIENRPDPTDISIGTSASNTSAEVQSQVIEESVPKMLNEEESAEQHDSKKDSHSTKLEKEVIEEDSSKIPKVDVTVKNILPQPNGKNRAKKGNQQKSSWKILEYVEKQPAKSNKNTSSKNSEDSLDESNDGNEKHLNMSNSVGSNEIEVLENQEINEDAQKRRKTQMKKNESSNIQDNPLKSDTNTELQNSLNDQSGEGGNKKKERKIRRKNQTAKSDSIIDSSSTNTEQKNNGSKLEIYEFDDKSDEEMEVLQKPAKNRKHRSPEEKQVEKNKVTAKRLRIDYESKRKNLSLETQELNINNNELNKRSIEKPKKSKSDSKKKFKSNEDENLDSNNSNTADLIPESDTVKMKEKQESDQNWTPPYGPYKRIDRCNVCLTVFRSYKKLRAHKKIHQVENPYQCNKCDDSFSDVEKLAAHLKIHEGKMPFSCKKCDSAFWTQFQLERHQLVHVLKKAPPPSKPPSKVFKCEECGKEFKKICDLERHTRVHTGEKPSVCNICNKRFQQPYNLNKHLYTHTQEKNFECVICQKKFGRNDVLNRHVLTHSIVKPFKCSVCSRTFIRNSQLKLHLRKYHDLDEDPGNETNDVDDAVASTSTD